jgi:hypothetical protein
MPYCYFHDRLHRVVLDQKSAKNAPIDLPPVEDRASIQIALSQVIRALAAGRMEPRRAGRLIYALQVALQFAPITAHYPDTDPVQSLSPAENGDDLAPVLILCEEGDKCSDCPYAGECELYQNEDEEDSAEEEDEDGEESTDDDDTAEEDDEDNAEETVDDEEQDDEDAEEEADKTGGD